MELLTSKFFWCQKKKSKLEHASDTKRTSAFVLKQNPRIEETENDRKQEQKVGQKAF